MPIQIDFPIGLLCYACKHVNYYVVLQRPIGNASTRPPKIPNVFGQPSNPYWHSSPLIEQLSPRKSQSLANCLASYSFYRKIVSLKDSIASKLQCSPTPFDFDLPHSAECAFRFHSRQTTPKYLYYYGQCQTNHLHLITFRCHSWNHVTTLSPSSSHTWLTYLSLRPLFHPNSNWHLSHRCWKNLVYQSRISQISDQY